MSRNEMIEFCKEDNKMSPTFKAKADNVKYEVYYVCQYSGVEVLLEYPEYRNNVMYKVKWVGEGS